MLVGMMADATFARASEWRSVIFVFGDIVFWRAVVVL